MKLAKGKEMEVLLSIFVGCAVIMFAAIYVYNQKESTAFHKTQEQITELKVKVRELETLLTSNISTVGVANMKVKELDMKVTCFTDRVDKAEAEVDHLQEHCAKLRESHITLKELLSRKRPVTKIQGPIEVQVVTPQQKLKSDAAKVKKQIKELGL